MTSPPPEYREIPLTKGQYAKVSPHRFDELMRFKWCASWAEKIHGYYAVRWAGRDINGKGQLVFMHRQILGLERSDRRKGDHRDHNTLNNVDSNLRVATSAQNSQNLRKPNTNKSGYKGVSWEERKRSWHAQISVDGKKKHLGNRQTAEAAYRELYVPAAIKYHGEFVCLD